MGTRQRTSAKAVSEGGKLTVRSALNPILWLCGLITGPGILSIHFLPEVPGWFIALISAPVATAILGFLFLLIVDRDKLQSEEYQLRKQSLELMQQKGELPIEVGSAIIIETPKENLLSSRDK